MVYLDIENPNSCRTCPLMRCGNCIPQNKSVSDCVKRNIKASACPIQVNQRTGHWIEHPEIETSAPEYLMFCECSECGDKQCFCKPDIHRKHFCNNCGVKMEEQE